MAKSVVLVAVVVALAMTTLQTTPTFSQPNARVVPQSLPEWEQIDSKLQALAIEKKMVRTQTLRDFLMGEVPNMVTYEVHTHFMRASWQMCRWETGSISVLRVRQPLSQTPSVLPQWQHYGNSNGSPHQSLPSGLRMSESASEDIFNFFPHKTKSKK